MRMCCTRCSIRNVHNVRGSGHERLFDIQISCRRGPRSRRAHFNRLLQVCTLYRRKKISRTSHRIRRQQQLQQ